MSTIQLREPPASHCDSCHPILKVLDCCPIIPLNQLLEDLSKLQNLYDLAMIFITALPWIFGFILFVNLLINRDLRSLVRPVTHLIAHLFCDIVKETIFREPRPDGACSWKFGMPSCHSIFASLYVTWIIYDFIVYPKRRITISLVIQFCLMVTVPYSRIYLIYHTKQQTIYGWIIGVIYAIIGQIVLTIIEYRRGTKRQKNKMN